MFLFKKILALFFFPVPLCLELLILGLVLLWFSRRQRAGKILVSLSTALLMICSYPLVPDLVLVSLEKRYPPVLDAAACPAETKGNGDCKYIVVLSGGNSNDQQLPVTSRIGEATLYRLVEGVRLYKAAPGRKLILSGGGIDNPVSEAQIMARAARAIGVAPEDLILESASRDTEEQARFIKDMVGRKKFFLVTSASHLPRAMAMFHKQEMAPVPAPAGNLVHRASQLTPYDFLPTNFFEFFPTSQSLLKAEIALHEYMGLAWAKLQGVI